MFDFGIDFGRDSCGNLAIAGVREWLVTNGIGGYAAGTVGGLLTRRYHGLLIAALKPPLGRTLLLTKFDEIADYDGSIYKLSANRWLNNVIDPTGYVYLERFHREGAIPVWTFAVADALLEKRVWMEQGANTTYIRYTLRRGAQPLALSVKAFVNYRDHHGVTRAGDWHMQITSVEHGLHVTAYDGAAPLKLLAERGEVGPEHSWYRDYTLSIEMYRGFEGREDHLHAGTFHITLQPGESFTLVGSTEADPVVDGQQAYQARRAYEDRLIAHSQVSNSVGLIRDLILAADQFIVSRSTPNDPDGQSIIAGYPWFGDWGRDTMISLPGLTLATGRTDVCARILRTFAQFIDQGMLPNRFPDAGETPEYNTVDATLWYFEAIRAYHAATSDDRLLRELYPALREIIMWHNKGTRYRIHVDPSDGLLYSGEPGVQLTWMDAKVEDWVVTPRIGKAIEINALWYNALRFMAEAARQLEESPVDYERQADMIQANFGRFWNDSAGYCYDVVDSPSGNDAELRPNQLFAVALAHSPLTASQQKAVVDVCARQLLTSHGLRSLAPNDPAYAGHYGGDIHQRDGAYHQGTVWGWLIGPFVSAHLRVYRDPALARQFLMPLLHHLGGHCVGSLSEIFDGDEPFYPRGCFAQAWSVAEVLRVWQATSA